MTNNKKIYTRKEFETMRLEKAGEMARDEELQKDALDVLIRADRYDWIHQSNWMGEPVLQLPQDMFAVQEIIYRTRPDFIIEVGVAWGGSILFYATICEALGHGRVVGVDIFMPKDMRERVSGKGKVTERIHLLEGSSIGKEIFVEVKEILGSTRNVMVLLDSNHTHDHVLQELKLYAPLIGKGHYLICGDTIIERLPEQPHRTRAWGKGNNPMTALNEFLVRDDRFVIDQNYDEKLLFTCSPRGYLRALRNAE
jgi:cephalosporin hydroxylase